VAQAIYQSAVSDNPKTRVRVGSTAKMMPLVKGILSDKAFDGMIVRQLGLLK
jgi:hypothetical protein